MRRPFCLVLLPTLHVASSFFHDLKANGIRVKGLPRCSGSAIEDHGFPDDSVIDEILQVAIEASKAAASIIKDNSDGSTVVEKKSTSRDLLTLIDPLCEKAIREKIVDNFPDHGILGEEAVAPGIDSSIAALEEKLSVVGTGWLWIVDPIDGTTNFASGIPINMPSIAVAYRGEVIVAVLNDPHRDELFTAVRGRGAHLNGKKIYVSDQDLLNDAVVGMESPAGEGSLQQCLQGIVPLLPKVRSIRMLGSSAVFLPWVANGRLTAYWTPDECAWDIAAGVLMVQEAGGVCTDIEGNDYTLRTRNIIASNGIIHEDLVRVLREEASLGPLVY
eukprot:scaffold961_cov122-Cylindrotheca_fusiformis.AAC.7